MLRQDEGKAMIVCMSRRICVDLYREIAKLRPNWHEENDDRGVMKVVMTGSASDPPDWQMHIRNKGRREELAKWFTIRPIRSRSRSFATCGSPASPRHRSTPC